MVYVLNQDGEPMMPTENHTKVRVLLKQGKGELYRQTATRLPPIGKPMGFRLQQSKGVFMTTEDFATRTIVLSV